jgi:hypothetical protein
MFSSSVTLLCKLERATAAAAEEEEDNFGVFCQRGAAQGLQREQIYWVTAMEFIIVCITFCRHQHR